HYARGLGLVSRIDGSGPAAYYQFDAQGNTAELTGAGGAVLNSYSYLPFGESLSTRESLPNLFTYRGQLGLTPQANGLHYMRNRWYDPVQGRFTTQDPIGLSGDTNFYAYAANNPVTFIDPVGLEPGLPPVIPLTPQENAWAYQNRQMAADRQGEFTNPYEP